MATTDQLELAALRARVQSVEAELAAARRGQNWLFEALDHVPEGLVLLDADDCFVYWNRRYAELYIRPEDDVRVGSSFEALLRAGMRRGQIADAVGREEEWLAARMKLHAAPAGTHEQQIATGEWVRVEHRRLSDGGSIGIRTDITHLKRSKASFQLLFDGNPVAMLVFDRRTLRILAANDEALRIYGYTREGMLTRTMEHVCAPDDSVRTSDPLEGGPDLIRRHLRADGESIMVRLCATRLIYEGGDATVCAVVDMSTMLRVEDDLMQARALLDSLVESIPLTVFAKDMRDDGRYVIFNRAAEALADRERGTVLGRTDRDIFGVADGERYRAQDREIMATGQSRTIEETCVWGGAAKRVLTKKLPIRPADDTTPRYLLGIQEDVTERRRIEQRMAYMAHHDSLTDLPNRVLFRQRLREAIDQRDAENIGFAVHSLDLDRFKGVNDQLGHGAGDALLAKVGERLRLAVRPSDCIARLGGDEFAILQTPVGSVSDATRFARRIVEVLSAPYAIGGHPVDISASIGVAPASADLSDVDMILRHADVALYQAKQRGGGRPCVFEEADGANLLAHRALEHDLRRAVETKAFTVCYQPLYCLQDRTITGFEALLRWNHPQRGPIAPLEFLPLAEEIGLIEEIGTWILGEACRQAASWPSDFRIAVNLSPIQIHSGAFAQTVFEALEHAGLAAHRLELEITESVLLIANDDCLATLNLLRGAGITLSLDDFGTGYSSLSYLHRLPFDRIKIDRSFVADLGQNPGSLAIVRAVVGLSSSLGIRTTAEGVETLDQLRRLQAEGCQEIQGLLDKPAAAGGPIGAVAIAGGLRDLTSPGPSDGPSRKCIDSVPFWEAWISLGRSHLRRSSGAAILGLNMILQSKSDAANPDTALPALLTTGQVARKFKVTLQTLHFYEDEGLVTPRRDNGRRIYDTASIARLAFVMEHRRLGMSLKKIAQLLAGSTLALVLAPMLRFTV